LIIATAGAGAFLLRWGVVLVAARHPLPERMVEITHLVAPSAAAALLAGSLVGTRNIPDLGIHLVVVAVGFYTALCTRSVLLTLLAGVTVYTLLEAIV
jgi:branched-subunit amino acid transport protein